MKFTPKHMARGIQHTKLLAASHRETVWTSSTGDKPLSKAPELERLRIRARDLDRQITLNVTSAGHWPKELAKLTSELEAVNKEIFKLER